MKGNPNVSDVTYTQKVSFDSATASAATQSATDAVTLYATEDCWIARGAAPTATTTAGATNIFIPASVMMTIPIIGGFKISAIKDSTAGDLHVYEHANIYP